MAPRDGRDLARALLARAHADQTLIVKVADDAEIADAIVGFHAQQAVEKAIKAVLAVSGIAFPKTHALGFLIDLLDRHGVDGPAELAQADGLAPWAVEFRYEVDGVPVLDRPGALRLVAAIVTWPPMSSTSDRPCRLVASTPRPRGALSNVRALTRCCRNAVRIRWKRARSVLTHERTLRR